MIFCSLCVSFSVNIAIRLYDEPKWNIIKSLILFLISHQGPFLIVLLGFFLKLWITTKSAFIYFNIIQSFTRQAPPLILILFTLTNLDTSFSRTFLMLWLLLFFLLFCLLFLCLRFWTDNLSSVSIAHTCFHALIYCLDILSL